MSLVRCPECGHMVSTHAPSCPKCGFPYKKYEDTAKAYGVDIHKEPFIEYYWISKITEDVKYIKQSSKTICAECGEGLNGRSVCQNCGFDISLYREEKRLHQEMYKKEMMNKSRKTRGNVDQPLMVHCPGCKKAVSYYADTCPDCGFPIRKFISEHNIQDIKKVHVCPKCANLYAGINYEKQPLYMACEFCNTPMLEIDADNAEVCFEKCFNWQNPDVDGLAIKILSKYANAKPDQTAIQHRNNILNRREQDEVRQEQLLAQANISAPNIPHCPACGSTDIENISTLNRAVSTAMVGIASKKIGKQFHCKNCGYNF